MSSSLRVEYFSVRPWPCFVVFVPSEEAWKRELKRIRVTEDLEFTKSCRDSITYTLENEGDGDTVIAVCLDVEKHKDRPWTETAGLMAHEASHVISEIGKVLKIKGNEEYTAYSLGFITQRLCMAVKDAQNKLEGDMKKKRDSGKKC